MVEYEWKSNAICKIKNHIQSATDRTMNTESKKHMQEKSIIFDHLGSNAILMKKHTNIIRIICTVLRIPDFNYCTKSKE